MTYNFDPDTWLNTNRAALAARRDRGGVSDREFEAELEDLDRRYDEMVARLDGTYEIPSGVNSEEETTSDAIRVRRVAEADTRDP